MQVEFNLSAKSDSDSQRFLKRVEMDFLPFVGMEIGAEPFGTVRVENVRFSFNKEAGVDVVAFLAAIDVGEKLETFKLSADIWGWSNVHTW